MELQYKLWIETKEGTIFGQGACDLLMLVDKTGSLHKAAAELKMSYRAAWGKIREYEERSGLDLLEKGRRGRSGASLTKAGRSMIEIYQQFLSEMEDFRSSDKIMQLLKEVGELKREA